MSIIHTASFWNPGESDGDDLADDHHYEALYEVINPRLQPIGAAASVALLDHQDDSFDDSFDSDDAFEEVVVRGLVIFLQFNNNKWIKKKITFSLNDFLGRDIRYLEGAARIEIGFGTFKRKRRSFSTFRPTWNISFRRFGRGANAPTSSQLVDYQNRYQSIHHADQKEKHR